MKCSKQIILILIVFQFILMSSLQAVSSENEVEIKKQIIEALINTNLNEDKSANQEIIKAFENLETHNPKRFVEVWFEIIVKNKDDLVKQGVLENLGLENSEKVIETVTRILLKNEVDVLTSHKASKVLKEMGLRNPEAVIEVLHKSILFSESDRVETVIERSIGILEKMEVSDLEKFVDTLIQTISKNEDHFLTKKALMFFEKIKLTHPEKAFEALVKITLESTDEPVKQEVFKLLEQMRFDYRKEVTNALFQIVLKDSSLRVPIDLLKKMKSENPSLYSKLLEEALIKNPDLKNTKNFNELITTKLIVQDFFKNNVGKVKSATERVKISVQGKIKATRK